MKDLFLESLQKVLIRDLEKLQSELKLYPNESSVWTTDHDIKNSGGNLTLHLCGNLQHYIGFILGTVPYQRNRDNEFAAKGIPLKDLLAEVDKAKTAIINTIPKLSEAQLASDYPADVFGHPMKTTFFLIHLTAHLSYHLGQVNYHRRLLAR